MALIENPRPTEFEEGSVYASGSRGPVVMAVRKDSTGPLTGVADGDVTSLLVDESGQLKIRSSVEKKFLQFCTSNDANTRGVFTGLFGTSTTGIKINAFGGTLPAFNRIVISYIELYSSTAGSTHVLQIWFGGSSIVGRSDNEIITINPNIQNVVDWVVPAGNDLFARSPVGTTATIQLVGMIFE